MDRRAFSLLIASSPVWMSGVRAARRPPSIGFLSPADKPGPNHRAFIDRLAKLGWIEGRTIHIEWRWLNQQYDDLPRVAEELASSDLMAIVTQTQAVTLAMMKVSRRIPIVFVGVRDPVAAGIVQSLNHPGGNVTGVTLAPTAEVVAKQYEVLKELLPALTRIAVLWNPDAPIQAQILDTIRTIGAALDISVKGAPISHQGDIENAFKTLGEERPQAVMVLVDSFSFANRVLIAKLAAEQRLPTSFETKDYVVAGGLVSYGLPYLDHYARGADFVSEILNGAEPRNLPIEQPTRYELVINAKTAKQIGLEIPAMTYARADEVIE